MKRIALALLLLAGLWCAPAEAWLTGYGYRVTVTIDATLVDEAIPVIPVYGSAGDTTFWGNQDTGGASLRPTETDDTLLPYYLFDTYTDSGTTGTFCMLVNVSSIISTSVDADFYIYFSNAGASDASSGSDVFSGTNIVAFYPFNGDANDITGSGPTLSLTGSATHSVSGPVEGCDAVSLGSSSDYYLSTTTPVTGFPYTMTAWALPDNDTGIAVIGGLGDSAVNDENLSVYFVGNTAGDPTRAVHYGDNNTNSTVSTTNDFAGSTWYYVSTSRDSTTSGTTIITSNGANAGTDTTNLDAPSFTRLGIGVQPRNSLYSGGGAGRDLAMVAFHSVARSQNYMSTDYNAWSGLLLTWGASEAQPATGDTGWVELTAATTTAASGNVDWSNPSNALTSLASAATADVPDTQLTYRLDLTNAGGALSEVTGYTILGVAVEVSATGEDTASFELYDSLISLIVGGSVTGNNKSTVTQWTDASINTREYGGSTDTWGLSLTDTQLTASNFGVALQFSSDGGSGPALMSVYRVRVRVYYDVGGDTSAWWLLER